VTAPEPTADTVETPWERVHPLTPYVRGWVFLVVMIFGAGRQLLDRAVQGEGVGVELRWIAIITGAVAVVVVLIFWWQWRFTRYRITPTQVQVRRGIVFRSERNARLDRVQSVDIARPLVARILGLSELRFEVADAGQSALKLEYLRAGDAEVLRREILARAAGVQRAAGRGPLAASAGPRDPRQAPDGGGAGTGPTAGFAAGPAAGTAVPADRPAPGTAWDRAPGDGAPGEGTPHDVGALGDAAAPGGAPTSGDGAAQGEHAASGTQGQTAPGATAPEALRADTGRQRLPERGREWAERMAADFSGTDPYGTMAGGTEDETPLVAVPTGRLIGSVILRVIPWLLAGVLGIIALIIWAPPGVFLSAAVPWLAGLLPFVWRGINAGYGFRAATSPDGLRVRHGLTETQHRTVPPGRVQAISVHAPLLWRPFGWVYVQANVAGYGGREDRQDGANSRSVLLPVGTLEDAAQVLTALLPDPGVADPWELVQHGMLAKDAGRFTTTPRRAWWLSPLAWRRQGFLATTTALVLRTGRLGRRLVFVPHARTQGLLASQGWLARLGGVADVAVATTAGPVGTGIPHVAAEVAGELVASQVARAAQAARVEDTNHWGARWDGGAGPEAGDARRHGGDA